MKNQSKPLSKSANVNKAADPAAALSSISKSVSKVLPKVAVETLPDPTKDQVGEFTLVPLTDVKVAARFRRDLGNLRGLADSIREVGLLQPILLNTDRELVGGMRRLEAHRLLNRERILARIIDLEDESLAAIEEDRSRKGLTATEKYLVTEALRDKMKDEAWRRRALGGKLEAAVQKGRVDDLLAKHVGISRPTLIKIRNIVEAAKLDPDRYGQIADALDQDGKVDRHYKELLAERAKDSGNARFRAIVVAPTWAALDPKILRKSLGAVALVEYADESAFLLVPTSVATLSQASDVVRLAKFGWMTTFDGSSVEQERLWLIGTLRKTLPQDDVLSLIAEAALNGFSELVDAVSVVVDGAHLVIDIAEVAQGRA